MDPMRKVVVERERIDLFIYNGYMVGTGAVGDPTQLWELPSHVLGRHHMKIRTAINTTHETHKSMGIGPFQDLQIRFATNPPNGYVHSLICI